MFQSGCCSLEIISEVGWSAGTLVRWSLRDIDDLKRLFFASLSHFLIPLQCSPLSFHHPQTFRSVSFPPGSYR